MRRNRALPVLLLGLLMAGCATLSYQKIPRPERKRYFELAAVVSQDKADEYAAIADSAGREIFWRRFWKEKDPTPTTQRNERYEEHLRRVAYADTFFSQRAFFWDDRGKIYIKYGEPDQRESNPMGDALYGSDPFASTDDMGADAEGEQRAVRIMSGTYGWERWTYDRMGTTLSFMQKDVGYFLVKDLAAAKSGSHRATVRSLQATELPMPFLEDSLRPDRYEHDYGQPLDFPFDLARFAAGGKAEVWISYSIPLDEIAYDQASRRGLLNRSIVIFDENLEEAGRDDKVLTPEKPAGLMAGDRGQAIDLVRFNLGPGGYTLAIDLMDLNSGKAGSYKYGFRVVDYRAGAEETSDLLLSSDIRHDSSGGMFCRGGYRMIPQPGNSFPAGRDLYYYYELYNLGATPAQPRILQARCLIFPKKGDRAMAAQAETVRTVTAAVGQAGGIAVSELAAGDYILVIEITDLQGGRVKNIARPFRVHK